MVTFARSPSTRAPGTGTHSRRVPCTPCGSAHTRLVGTPGTAASKQQTSWPAFFRCALDQKRAREVHLRPSDETLEDTSRVCIHLSDTDA